MSYRSGTSGLVLPVPNKQHFPPEYRDKSRLTYFASLFNSIEINSSFYKVPLGSTVAKWADSVPDDFTFTFKLWREITHAKDFVFDMQAVDHFMSVIDHAGDKKGSLLIQLPPKITIEKREPLELLFERVRDYGWHNAIEFRHPSWYTSEIYAMADNYDFSIVMHDMPASINSVANQGSRFRYLRFHGVEGDYKGSYTDEALYAHSVQIKQWLKQGLVVYVYFNNTIGDAIKNLQTLNNLVGNKQ
jgi:uncharacterized protein YecE (DUF72 family)